MQYRREIDGLRAVAVLPVVLFHAGVQGFGGGYVGVDVFFVISGYLITSIILAEQADGSFSLAGFYERRARRILPALFTVLLLCLPFAWLWMLPNLLQEFADSLVAVSTFVSNLFFMRLPGYFDSPAGLKPLLHTWSLAVEEQYYLFFPLFLLLCMRFARRLLVPALIAVALLSLALAQAGADTTQEGIFYFTPARVWELMLGALAALYHFPRGFVVHRPLIAQPAALLGLALIVFSVVIFDHDTPWPSIDTLVPAAGTALVILFASEATLVGRLLSWRGLVFVGLISYSLYLWHQPLLAFARVRSIEEPGEALLLSLCLLALLLAILTWHFIERPLRDRRRFSRRSIFTAAAVMSAAFIVVGVVTSRAHGFANRAAVARLDIFLPEDIRQCVYPTGGYRRVLCASSLVPLQPGGQRRLLFVGDSLLAAARDGIVAGAQRTGLGVNFAPVWGCPALLGVTRQVNGRGSAPCSRYTQAVYELIHTEQVTDVVLLSAFNRYLRQPLPGHVDMKAGRDDRERGCDADAECIAQTRDALVRTVGTLQSWQVRVWLMRQLPDYGQVFAKDDLNERVFFDGDDAARMPRAYYASDSRPFDEALAGTGAGVIDFSARFCGALFCSPLVGGRMAYADNDHLGSHGSLMLADDWARALTAIARAPRP